MMINIYWHKRKRKKFSAYKQTFWEHENCKIYQQQQIINLTSPYPVTKQMNSFSLQKFLENIEWKISPVIYYIEREKKCFKKFGFSILLFAVVIVVFGIWNLRCQLIYNKLLPLVSLGCCSLLSVTIVYTITLSLPDSLSLSLSRSLSLSVYVSV